MKSYLLPTWMLFVLVGSLFAASPTQAQRGPGPIAGVHVHAVRIVHTATNASTTGGSDIYTDTLRNNWINCSWATVNLANTAPVCKGGASIAVNCDPWQAFFLYRRAFHTNRYGSLTFWINGGPTGGQKLQVQALLGNNPQSPVALSPLPANTWTQVTLPLTALGAANQPNMDGFWIQDTTGTTQPTFYVDEIHLQAAAQTTSPPAPTGLTANGQWLTYCTTCQMPMAHILLNWNPVPGAFNYTVYRDGTPLQAGVTAANYTDMTVDSGQTYTYTVCTVGTSGISPQSAPATATAPTPARRPLRPPTWRYREFCKAEMRPTASPGRL